MLLQLIHAFAILSAAVVDIIFLAGFEISERCNWVNILHIGSFSILFGANIWVILIAGLLLIREIPRHMFGKSQSVILSAFNSFSFGMSCLTLTAIFLQYPYHRIDSWGSEILFQVACIATAMMLFALQVLYIVPQNVKLMNKIYLFEREAGIGEEIAIKAPFNEELQMNEEYKQLRRRFGMWHGISAMTGLITLVLLCFHVYYLASKIDIFPARQIYDSDDSEHLDSS